MACYSTVKNCSTGYSLTSISRDTQRDPCNHIV